MGITGESTFVVWYMPRRSTCVTYFEQRWEHALNWCGFSLDNFFGCCSSRLYIHVFVWPMSNVLLYAWTTWRLKTPCQAPTNGGSKTRVFCQPKWLQRCCEWQQCLPKLGSLSLTLFCNKTNPIRLPIYLRILSCSFSETDFCRLPFQLIWSERRVLWITTVPFSRVFPYLTSKVNFVSFHELRIRFCSFDSDAQLSTQSDPKHPKS